MSGLRRVVLIVVAAGATVGCGAERESAEPAASTAPTTAATAPDPQNAETIDVLRFDAEPLPLAGRVAGVETARRLLPFDLVEARDLGTPREVWVQENHIKVAFVYDGGRFGRFNVYQSSAPRGMTLEANIDGLRQLAEVCASEGCEGALERMVRLEDGTNALLIVGNPAYPRHTTSVLWFDEELSWNVIGPVGDFTGAEALGVANAFATEAGRRR